MGKIVLIINVKEIKDRRTPISKAQVRLQTQTHLLCDFIYYTLSNEFGKFKLNLNYVILILNNLFSGH